MTKNNRAKIIMKRLFIISFCVFVIISVRAMEERAKGAGLIGSVSSDRLPSEFPSLDASLLGMEEEMLNVNKPRFGYKECDDCASLLHVSCDKKDLPFTEFLVGYGADVNARDKFQASPLFYVQELEIVKFLLLKGADRHTKNSMGESLFYNAIRSSPTNIDVLHYYFDQKMDMTCCNSAGYTLLHALARSIVVNKINVRLLKATVTFLFLREKICLNKKNNRGDTAQDLARRFLKQAGPCGHGVKKPSEDCSICIVRSSLKCFIDLIQQESLRISWRTFGTRMGLDLGTERQ